MASASVQRRGSIAGDTEVSFGSLGDESVLGVGAAAVSVASADVNGSAVPDDLLDRIGLAQFTNDEKFQLDNLLQRVHTAQASDEKHKERLRQELELALSQVSTVQESVHSGWLYKMCDLCGAKLYPFSRRFVCQRCENLACQKCVHQLRGGSELQCHLCYLEFLTEAQSGEWFMAEVRRRSERSFFGPEILRASLRRERKRLVSEEKARRAQKATESATAVVVNGFRNSAAAEIVAAVDKVDAPSVEAAAATQQAVDPKRKHSAEKRAAKAAAESEKKKEKQKKRSKEQHKKDKRFSSELPAPPTPQPPVLLTVAEASADDDVAMEEVATVAAATDVPAIVVDASADDDEALASGELQTEAEALEVAEALMEAAVETKVAAAFAEAAMDATDDAPPAAADVKDEDASQESAKAVATLEPPSNLSVIDTADPLEAAQPLSQPKIRRSREIAAQPSLAVDAAKAQLQRSLIDLRRLSAAGGAAKRPMDLRMRALLNRMRQSANETSQESVMSNISETEESYRRVTAGGEVEVSIHMSSSSLTVVVHQCRNLSRIDGRQPNPYVKTYLLPDKTKRSKRRTHARRGNCNPTFGNQPLAYPDLQREELDLRTLQISAWHSVPLGANLFMGEVRLPMEQCHLTSGQRQWLQLSDRHADAGVSLPTLMYQGELELSIRFESPDAGVSTSTRGRLEVWVRSCSKLAAGGTATSGAALDISPYAKSYLLPDRHQSSKRKSKVSKSNPNPQFNAMFTYNGVTLKDLRERSIELTVWDHIRLGRNDFLGGVRLNTGDSTRHNWMDARGHEQTLWSGMLENPNKWIDASLILRPNMDPMATHVAL